jgi:SAM-dependent methyltransferase
MRDGQRPGGLLNRIVSREWMQLGETHERSREYDILAQILSHFVKHNDRPTLIYPGSGYGGIFLQETGALFSDWRLVGFDIEHAKCVKARTTLPVCQADLATTPFSSESADVVFFDLVLHHLVTQGILETAIAEGVRCLKPGGLLIAFEPNLWNPVGASIELARRLGFVTQLRGMDDDVPLSPRYLRRVLRERGCSLKVEGVTFVWRRLPPSVQKLLIRMEPYLLKSRLSIFARTLMFVACKDGKI